MSDKKKITANQYINKRIKPGKEFFSWCKSQIPTITFKSKNKIISSNRKNCYEIVKRLTIKTHLDFFDKKYFFAIIIANEERIEIQTYEFDSIYNKGIQSIDYELVNYELYQNNEHIKVTEDYFYNYQAKRKKYIFGLTPIYGGIMNGYYTNVKFYPNNFEEKIKEISELRYLNLELDRFRIDVHNICHLYKYRNQIEFLQKINCNKIAEDIIRMNANYDMRVITKKWLKENKSLLKNTDKDFNYLLLEKNIKILKGKIIPGIEDILNYKDLSKIPDVIGIVKFQNWAIKNHINKSMYFDYLNLLKELDIEVNKDNVTPSNLQKEHDKLVKEFNLMKKQKEDIAFKNSIAKQKRLLKEIDNFVFILPKSSREVLKEGQNLHHCVGSYVEKIVKGKTMIIFMRDINNINKSLYTIEFNNNKIQQIRGKNNQNPDEEVLKVAKKWEKLVTTK